jgi:hypothetical protein
MKFVPDHAHIYGPNIFYLIGLFLRLLPVARETRIERRASYSGNNNESNKWQADLKGAPLKILANYTPLSRAGLTFRIGDALLNPQDSINVPRIVGIE